MELQSKCLWRLICTKHCLLRDVRDSDTVRGLKSSQLCSFDKICIYKTTRDQSLIDYVLQSGSVNKDSKKEGFTMAWQVSGVDSLGGGVFPGGQVVKNLPLMQGNRV